MKLERMITIQQNSCNYSSSNWTKPDCMGQPIGLTGEVKEGITGLDVGQEGIPKALAFSSTFHQTSNVRHIEESRNFAAGHNIKH